MKQRVLFIDRDGTIIREPADEQVDSLQKLEFLPDAITQLARIAKQTDFRLVMVTNQDGLGTPSFPENDFWPAHQMMLSVLDSQGVVFDEVLIDRTTPEDGASTRKPGLGMLQQYVHGAYDLAGSYVIGDRSSDVQLAANLGARAIRIGTDIDPGACLTTESWRQIAQWLIGSPRTAHVRRDTSETSIEITLNLDGTGEHRIATGIGFFDHMLEQVARHGQVDLHVTANGDLHIDSHHTIEDVAISLGTAIDKALGQRRGISRYGFLLPMDDAMAQVALDFGGRPWMIWEATFRRERIGGMPTEMFSHFFKSLSDAARCNLQIRAAGENEHHKIEAIFKGFARALRMAICRGREAGVPSTKGVL
ncbi:MAG: bifunctional histidinol-phosphatase/imidazoleglycerol-phosphate dehydratase HisB [Saprospiraceae bacterium]|nr:bifunctional histidinol-phosphatase/imidazoleglycerol-phosphate dehydratase HisB [Saprospiraceae bacterium]